MSDKSNSEIQCNMCARKCNISSNEVGYCGVVQNRGGVLDSLVYSKFIFLKVENATLFVGGIGSNMRFSFDMDWDTGLFPYLQSKELGREKVNGLIKGLGYTFSPKELIDYAQSKGCSKIVFKFNEPVVYTPYILDLAQFQKIEIGLVTNGYLSEYFFDCVLPKISSLDILFFSTFDKFYFKHSRAQLEIIKENILRLYNMGFQFRILYPLIQDENDSVEDIESLSKFLAGVSKSIPLVFMKYYPSYRMVDKCVTEKDILYRSKEIALKNGIQNVILEQ